MCLRIHIDVYVIALYVKLEAYLQARPAKKGNHEAKTLVSRAKEILISITYIIKNVLYSAHDVKLAVNNLHSMCHIGKIFLKNAFYIQRSQQHYFHLSKYNLLSPNCQMPTSVALTCVLFALSLTATPPPLYRPLIAGS